MRLLIAVFLLGACNLKTVTANFTTANANSERQPVFILEFDSLTRKYCTGTFSNISVNHKKLISGVSISATGISIPKNNPKIGKAVITIVNEGLDVSDFITQNNLHQVNATIKFGFQSLADSDFMSFDRWIVSEIHPTKTGDEIVLILRDASALATKKVFGFEQTTNLDEPNCTGSDGSIVQPPHNVDLDVDSTTGFIDTTNLPAEISEYIRVGVIIQNTTIEYTLINSGTQFGSAGTPIAGFGSPQEGLKDDQTVKQIIACVADTDSALRLFVLHFLLSTDDGTGHAYYDLTSYDSNFKGFGVGLTDSDVNIDQIENFMGLVNVNSIPFSSDAGTSAGIVYRTTGKEKNALEFISEFLNGFGAFLFVGSIGKWELGTYDSTEIFTEFTSVVDFAEDDVLDFKYSIDWRNLINQMDFRYDSQLYGYLPDGKESTISKELTLKLDASVTAYGAPSRNFQITNDFSGVSTTNNFILNCYARKWLYAFANPPANFSLKSRTKNILYDPGDKVLFSLAKEIDMTGASSSRGWSDKKSIITGQDIVMVAGRFDVTYRGILFDIFDEVSGFHTDDTEITAGDMDDSTLDPTGLNTVAINAKHAFIDFSSSLHTSDAFRFTIQWTNPNSGTSHHLFSIALHVQTAVPATIFTVVVDKYIRYFSGDSNTIKRTFFCVDESLGGTNVEKIKIAAFDLRTTADGAVTGAEVPSSMTVTSIIRTNLDKTISVV